MYERATEKWLFYFDIKTTVYSIGVVMIQFKEEGWYERLGGNDNTLADAIMGRIVYDTYKINIEGLDPTKDLSMREIYGLDPMQST